MMNISVVEIANEIKNHLFSVEVEHTNSVGSEECGACNGNGRDECFTCGGRGQVETYYLHVGDDDYVSTGRDECPNCDGTGTDGECSECDGTGNEHSDCMLLSEWDNEKTDSSCGYETVLERTCLAAILPQWGLLAKDLGQFSISYRCGGHVHIDWSAFVYNGKDTHTLTNLLYLGRILSLADGTSRMGYLASYLNLDERRADTGYGIRRQSWYSQVADYTETYWPDEVDRIIQTRYTHGYNPMGDRSWIALDDMSNRDEYQNNTVEFRFWDSPETAEDLVHSVLWSMSLLYLCREMESSDVMKIWNRFTENEVETFYYVVDMVSAIEKEVRAFLESGSYNERIDIAV